MDKWLKDWKQVSCRWCHREKSRNTSIIENWQGQKQLGPFKTGHTHTHKNPAEAAWLISWELCFLICCCFLRVTVTLLWELFWNLKMLHLLLTVFFKSPRPRRIILLASELQLRKHISFYQKVSLCCLNLFFFSFFKFSPINPFSFLNVLTVFCFAHYLSAKPSLKSECIVEKTCRRKFFLDEKLFVFLKST